MSTALEEAAKEPPPPYKKTEKQCEAVRLMRDHEHVMLDGGSRSGKTSIILRQIILRGAKKQSRHLCVRFRFKHAKDSLALETIPEVFESAFPGLPYSLNKTDWIFRWPAQNGGESELWIGGVDEKERSEAILGKEYSTIHANEISQIPFSSISLLHTRLAQTSGLKLRMFYDCNPPNKRHWAYRWFFEGITPEKEKHGLDAVRLAMNPGDNLDNLDPAYLKILAGLTKRQRQRFLDGLWLDDTEGALWTDEMINRAKLMPYCERRKTVVAIDPAVTSNKESDDTGIIVFSLDIQKNGWVEADLSGKMTPKQWAQKAVTAYYEHDASYIVAEVNQGGDMVEAMIHNIDPTIKVVMVRASKGKFARAEPVSMLYEQGRIGHVGDMLDLEEQLTMWVPKDEKESPDRMDALVWAATDLMLTTEQMVHIG
jgi:hypothetical protein